MIKILTLILPSIFSFNQGVSAINSVKAQDQFLNWSTEGEAEYIIDKNNRTLSAMFTEWDLSEIGINSIDDLTDNYARVVLMETPEMRSYSAAYFTSPDRHLVYIDRELKWAEIDNIKDVRVQSYKDFEDNAKIIHIFLTILGGWVQIEWRVMMSYYIADNGHFILQITSGFTGFVQSTISYEFKIGFTFSPYLKLEAK